MSRYICPISGGFYFYDLWGALASMSIAPMAVIAYSALFGEVELIPDRESRRGKRLYELFYYALLFSITLSLRSDSFLGFAAAHTAAASCTLFALKQKGIKGSLIAGGVCGLAAGLVYAPLYALSALAASFFIALSPLAAATAVLVCGAIFCAFFGTAQDFISLFPAQLVGLVIFCAWGMICQRFSLGITSVQKVHSTSHSEDSLRERLQDLSDGFGELADDLARLSYHKKYPNYGELRAACDRVCDRFCPKCENKTLCWELEYSSTLKMINGICEGALRGEELSFDSIAPHMRGRCRSLSEILGAIEYEKQELLRKKAGGSLSSFTADYRALSAIIASALEESAAENAYREDESEAARRIFRRMGIGFASVSVCGRRHVRISADGVDLSRSTCRLGELRSALEEIVGRELSPASFVPREDGETALEFSAKRKFSVCFGAARSAADGNFELCGDRVCRAERPDGYFYAVICDGMGTGYDASLASGKCGIFLRRMLTAGMSAETALTMLNEILRADSDECSVSLDLLRIDLLSGEASLYKSGAAPTYLRRGGKIFPIDAPGVPIGILAEPELTKSDFSLQADDTLLLSSDGVDSNGEIAEGRSVWLFDILEQDVSVNELARRVVRAARQSGSRDDISAVVLKIVSSED